MTSVESQGRICGQTIPAQKNTLIDRQLRTEAQNDALSPVLDFVRAAAYSGVQTPINGVVQLVHKDWLPNVQIIQPTTQAKNTFAQHAQTLGSAAGMALDFVAIGAMPEVAGAGLGLARFGPLGRQATAIFASAKWIPQTCSKAQRIMTIAKPIAKSGAAGATYEGIFTPIAQDEGSPLLARVKHAGMGALMFSTMTAQGMAIHGISSMSALNKIPLASILRTNLGSSTLAGLGSGWLTAEVESKGQATRQQLSEKMYEGAAVGCGVGALHSILNFHAECKSAITYGKKAKTEIDRLTAQNKNLRRIASTDERTGLLNNRAFNAIATREFSEADRKNRPISLLFGDLDGFKKVNDILGHTSGDRALREAANRLSYLARAADYVARVGGDEFAVLLPDTNLRQAELFAIRIGKQLPFNADAENDLPVSMSLGVVQRGPHEDVKEVLERADNLMYKNKQSRKRTSILRSDSAHRTNPQP